MVELLKHSLSGNPPAAFERAQTADRFGPKHPEVTAKEAKRGSAALAVSNVATLGW